MNCHINTHAYTYGNWMGKAEQGSVLAEHFIVAAAVPKSFPYFPKQVTKY